MLAEILIFVPIVLNLIYVFIAAKHPNLLVMNSPVIHGCSPSSDCSVSDLVKVNYPLDFLLRTNEFVMKIFFLILLNGYDVWSFYYKISLIFKNYINIFVFLIACNIKL